MSVVNIATYCLRESGVQSLSQDIIESSLSSFFSPNPSFHFDVIRRAETRSPGEGRRSYPTRYKSPRGSISAQQERKTPGESSLLSNLNGGAANSKHLGQFRIELLQLLRVLLLPDLKVVIEGPQRVEQSILAMCQLVVMEVGVGELEGQEVGATIVQRDAHAQQLPLQDSGAGEPEATDVAGVGGANGVEEGVENADSICLSESLATAKGEDAHGLIA
ncbi:hypothetical protein PG997_000658 [Apiospora hydei]|uniref:Uncharacterized protein n=1 Tax=Apiospora hydei TaxID=1337664 RepID=A0ABR1XBK9_9PEZI